MVSKDFSQRRIKETRPKVYPKLKNYQPTRFMLTTSHYDKAKVGWAVTFIENLCHTKGKWAGKRFWLLPWQEQLIRDIFGIVKHSTTDKYIHSKTYSNAHQTVFTKESDKYQWLVLGQKSQCEVEVRQTDNHGTITARDNYELTGNLPKCVGVERLCEYANFNGIVCAVVVRI